jgi:acyl-CoA thioester hydrolase
MAKDFPPPQGIEAYRGNVNTWECDEMGHMNVRFYVAKAEEAIVVLLARMGYSPAELTRQNLRALSMDYHVRFLAELHPGAGVYAHAGILEARGDYLRVFVDLRHGIGHRPAATFNVLVQLQDDTDEFRSWPPGVIAATQDFMVDLPDFAAPKSLDLEPSRADASLTRSEELGLHQINLGIVHRDQCDLTGEMKAEWFMGRVSDGIGNLIRTFNPERGEKGSKVGGAALEYRIIIRRRPRPGDILAIRSGLASVADKTFTMCHWMIDMETGDAVATMAAAAASFDIEKRKIIPITDERKALMQKHLVEGLAY